MTGTSEAQVNTDSDFPIQLPADGPSAAVDPEVNCRDTQPGCSKNYHDIIYVTGQRRFWLLPKRVKDQLQENILLLRQQTVDSDRAARMSSIADSGLLDYFITPGPEAFLEVSESDTGERHRYEHSKATLLEEPDKQAQYRSDWEIAKAKGDSTAAMQAERALFRSQRRVIKHQQNIAELDEIGYRRAEALGYKRENGVFYTPRALEARDAVDVYIAEQRKAVERGFTLFDPGGRNIATYWEHLRDYKKLHETLVSSGVIDERALRGVRINILNLEAPMRSYLDAIVNLAECGIAVPEFALSPDDQNQGSEDFQAYGKLLAERRALEVRIEERYAHWVSATAGNAAPPGEVFTELQDQWRRLNEEAQQIKDAAEARVRDSLPPRLFLWDPQSYSPQPIERLVKMDIPLREFSSADALDVLNHISLKNFAKLGMDVLGAASGGLKVLPQSIAKQADDDQVFSAWLQQEGAHVLDEKGPWFDDNGLFVPEQFFAALEASGFQVESLQAQDKRQRWGATLKAMVFEDRQLRNMMLFDNSTQAQLIRCLLPADRMQQTAFKVQGPQWKKGKGAQVLNAQLTLDVALWRGEVSLFNIELPKRSNALPLTPSYIAYDGSRRTLDLGRLSLNLSAKAWGFTGASLLLARDLTLDQATGYTSIAGLDIAEKKGELGKFNLFVGAQAGCKLSGQLYWYPPASVLPPAPVPHRSPNNPWLPLAKLDIEVAAGVGAGLSGELKLQLHKGRFIFSIQRSLIWGVGLKGYMSFEIGYECVGQLLELVCREMARNHYKNLEWIDSDALQLVKQLGFLGALNIDVGFLYLRGYMTIKALYQALTDGGRGGQIAYTLKRGKNQKVMHDWVLNLPPQALGPLLMALISTPRAFTIKEEGKDPEHFHEDQAWLLQQQAIHQCLIWISHKPDAQRQFEDALICMNRDGVRPEQAGRTYCENRLRLDLFMAERVLELERGNASMRAQYRECVARLGRRLDGYCISDRVYRGPAFAPVQTIKIRYEEPNID